MKRTRIEALYGDYVIVKDRSHDCEANRVVLRSVEPVTGNDTEIVLDEAARRALAAALLEGLDGL